VAPSINAPNAITTIRILLVPVVIVVLLETEGASALAAAVFALAASTDGLDGYVARSRQEVTTFGKVMDPIADKLLIVAALVALVGLDRVAAWVAVVIIARELAVSGLRIVAAQQGLVIAASGLGRAKTVCQVAAVLALIAAGDPRAAWVLVLVYAAVAITIASGVDYFRGFLRREAATPGAPARSTAPDDRDRS
jgi:CDP-diacylglycerol--glycerol-3-phosphate 3-phosphatidyltransferase